MGFMDAKFATRPCSASRVRSRRSRTTAAARDLKNIHTDILCKPWYVGNALPYHIPNNTDITVDYKDGKVVLKEKCFAIAPVDKELAQTRVWEKKFNLNTASRTRDDNRRMTIRAARGRRSDQHCSRFSVFGVDWQLLKPFIVIGLAFGGVYALSGVGLVVLYRATGVLNLAFGAIGAAGALIAYYIAQHTGWPDWLAFTICVLSGGVVNLLYGMVFGPAFARRDPLVKMMGTLGLALILLGLMAWRAPIGGAFARFLPLPSSTHLYTIWGTSGQPDPDHRHRARLRDHRRA